MAAERYIRLVNSSPLHANEAGEVIEEGDFVYLNPSDGKVYVADPSGSRPVDGIVPRRERGDVLREHAEDYGAKQYSAGEGPVPVYQLEDGAELPRDALTASEQVSQFEEVAFDSNLAVVPSSSGNAASATLGTALNDAASDEDVAVRLGL